MKEHMDFSGYDKSHPCYDNAKVLCRFMDEHDGTIFTRHIGLKPKCTVVKLMIERHLTKVKAWIEEVV